MLTSRSVWTVIQEETGMKNYGQEKKVELGPQSTAFAYAQSPAAPRLSGVVALSTAKCDPPNKNKEKQSLL